MEPIQHLSNLEAVTGQTPTQDTIVVAENISDTELLITTTLFIDYSSVTDEHKQSKENILKSV